MQRADTKQIAKEPQILNKIICDLVDSKCVNGQELNEKNLENRLLFRLLIHKELYVININIF